jgi:hypothetical protein
MPTIYDREPPTVASFPDGTRAAVLVITDGPRTSRWRDNYNALAREHGTPAYASGEGEGLSVVVPLTDGTIQIVCDQLDLAAALIGGSPPTDSTFQTLGFDTLSTDTEPSLHDKVNLWWEFWRSRHPGGQVDVVVDLDPPLNPSAR